MARFSAISLAVVFATSVGISLGCGDDRSSEPAAAPAAPDNTSVSEEESKVNEALSKLSPADRKLAEAQQICPVTDEPLGSMGTPIKVTVDGHDVFVCCAGCEDELKSNFDEYVAKIEKRAGK